MSKGPGRVMVLGYFGYETNQLDGQTVKTRDIYRLLAEGGATRRGDGGDTPPGPPRRFDTQRLKRRPWEGLRMLWMACGCDTLVYLPAHNNLRYIFPVLFVLSHLARFRVHYFVVGGWLCEFLSDKPLHRWMLRRVAGIHAETRRLRRDLEERCGMGNVDVFPNFRFFDFQPGPREEGALRLVFMARVMREKGLDWMFHLAERLAEKGLGGEVTITFYGPLAEKDRDWFLARVDKYPFVRYEGALQPDAIYRALSRHDVLLLPTHFYTEGLPGSVVDAYIAGVPVIATRWKNAEEFIDEGRSGFIVPFEDGQEELVERVLRLHADRELLRRMQACALKKREQFSPPPYVSDTLRVVYVSRLIQAKGLDTLVTVARLVDGGPLRGKVTVDFYGQDCDGYFPAHLGGVPWCRYRGALSPDEVTRALSGYDALLFPTHYEGEGCPGILVEALASGLPIVASDWKDNGEFVTPGVNGYLCPALDAASYARALHELWADPRRRAEMGRRSRGMAGQFCHARAGELMREILN